MLSIRLDKEMILKQFLQQQQSSTATNNQEILQNVIASRKLHNTSAKSGKFCKHIIEYTMSTVCA